MVALSQVRVEPYRVCRGLRRVVSVIRRLLALSWWRRMRWRSSARRGSRSGRSPTSCGFYDSTLGNWVREEEINRGEREGLTSDERERLRELERENARLRMERELLKRAVAFWVRESNE